MDLYTKLSGIFTPSELELVLAQSSGASAVVFREPPAAAPQNLPPITWFPQAYEYTPGTSLDSQLYGEFGKDYYLANKSSLLAVKLLSPTSHDVTLDMCAAPGGKSFLAYIFANKSLHLYVNEAENHRRAKLIGNLRALSVPFIHAFGVSGVSLPRVTPQKFSKIILDVPCSGESICDITDSAYLANYWSQKKVNRLSKLQYQLLASAYQLLEPGGELVYSTCTYSPEENELPIDHLLSVHTDINTVDLKPSMLDVPDLVTKEALFSYNDITFSHPDSLKNCVRILPASGFQGFFICKLQKKM